MIGCKGFYSSFISGSAIDGAGVRVVIFLSKCNIACPYCQNIDVIMDKGTETTPPLMLEKILRYKEYIKNGGVTLSGGEPLIQEEFCFELTKLLKENNINVAIETNGVIFSKRLARIADTFIVDIKNQFFTMELYEKHFQELDELGKDVQPTCVIIKGVNDDETHLKELKVLLNKHPSFHEIKFLPFKKLCKEKYDVLHIPFPYDSYDETDELSIKAVNELYSKL